MKLFIMTLMILQFNFSEKDSIPPCIKTKLKDNVQFVGTRELPILEKVYELKITKPPECIDCISGTIFLDSLCNTIANFTTGRGITNYVKEGYKKEWFDKFMDQKVNEKNLSSNEYFFQFKSPVKFKVKKINSDFNPLKLKVNDILEISLQNGMYIYRSNSKTRHYKLIPEIADFILQKQCIKPPCPSTTYSKSYFRNQNLGILITNNSKKNVEILIYDFELNKTNNMSLWNNVYELQNI